MRQACAMHAMPGSTLSSQQTEAGAVMEHGAGHKGHETESRRTSAAISLSPAMAIMAMAIERNMGERWSRCFASPLSACASQNKSEDPNNQEPRLPSPAA